MLNCSSTIGKCLPRISARALATTHNAQGSIKNLEFSPEEKKASFINIYSRLNSWKTRELLIDELVKGIVYIGEDLIAVNKPYGLANHATKDSPYSVEDCLKQLSDRLEVG